MTTIDQLAEICGMSRDNLSRSFSKDIGIPLKTWLSRELFKKAEQELLNTDETARNVAIKLNFSSEYYFSRFFKKYSGIAPGEYRKKKQNIF